ncbi:hypothetical protein [Vibrio sp. R78045]|uniref:hypothetical protein n=1 Tax=Vibrio sp. R78045 TaxID=3093868 RepID=UPI0036F31EAA
MKYNNEVQPAQSESTLSLKDYHLVRVHHSAPVIDAPCSAGCGHRANLYENAMQFIFVCEHCSSLSVVKAKYTEPATALEEILKKIDNSTWLKEKLLFLALTCRYYWKSKGVYTDVPLDFSPFNSKVVCLVKSIFSDQETTNKLAEACLS